ncbi:MAG TPA: hypothetical protein VFP96_15035, partial [Candidatus Acidoferrum sp.]|nr:hypothetical protein [Candidatus Acidoferrum sp.]
MIKRIAAILGIFACTCVAWIILGTSIFYRTDNLEPVLSARVGSTWGTTQAQKPPTATYYTDALRRVKVEEDGKKVEKEERYSLAHPVELASSRVAADFQIDYRKKGLLWFSTYKVAFGGEYTFKNPTGVEEAFTIRLPLPAKQAVYDNLELTVDGAPLALTSSGQDVSAIARVAPNATANLKVGYRSQGLDQWSYQFSNGEEVARINDFHLLVKTNFDGFDFPEN